MRTDIIPDPGLREAADQALAVIRERLIGRAHPFLVAFDGASGSGKSSVAALVTEQLDAVAVPGDDFFAANITNTEWEARSPEERARDAIDWRRLRAEALEPLLAGRRAKWYPFDFASGVRPDGTYAMSRQAEIREPSSVIVLDGAYSTRPELQDLIDLSVLVDVPIGVRHQRLAEREDAGFLAAWHSRWDEAEAWYFSEVRPRDSLDLVVTNE